jgi:hypothetical protein
MELFELNYVKQLEQRLKELELELKKIKKNKKD